MAFNHFPKDLNDELLLWADEKQSRVDRLPAWLGDCLNSLWRARESLKRRMQAAESRVRVLDLDERETVTLAVGDWERPIACHPLDHVFINIDGFHLELRVIHDRDGKPLALEVNNARPSRHRMVVVPHASNVVYIQGVSNS